MADITLTAVSPVSPAPQKSGQENPRAESSPEQPSFASVLKDRNAAQQSTREAAARNGSAREGSRDKLDGKSAGHAETQSAQAPAASSQSSAEAPAEPTAGSAVEALLASLLGKQQAEKTDAHADAGVSGEGEAETAQAVDTGSANPLAALPIVTSGAAIAAGHTASLAGQGAGVAASNLALAAGEQGQAGSTGIAPSALTAQTEAGNAAPTAAALAATGAQEASLQDASALKETSFGDALAAARHASQFAAQQATSHTQPSQDTTAVPQQVVRTPVGNAGWADEVGQRIGWVASRDAGRAELVLTPPSMGRVEVSINMNGDQATASFVAANPVAREALQDALPRLREMLSQAGIQLTQADVGAGQQGQAQSGQQGHSNRQGHALASGLSGPAEAEANLQTGSLGRIQSGRGMVDIFA